MRQLILTPRWIVWHVLSLGAMVTCGLLAAWQWQRAGSAMGSALNVGYGLQWPLFAVFFGYMWFRFLRMAAADLAAEAEAGESGAGAPEGSAPQPEAPVEPAAPSPFGPRPASYRVAPVTDEENPALAEYNRMLAALAARDAAG